MNCGQPATLSHTGSWSAKFSSDFRQTPSCRRRQSARPANDAHQVDGVWIVDPLDGTREFSEPPRRDWAVHVALVVEGAPNGRCCRASRTQPHLVHEHRTHRTCPPVAGRRPRLLVSRIRPPALSVEPATRMDGEVVPLGLARAKAMAVVLDEADVYVHAGGQCERDSAAPVAVALAAGFHASRVDGSPLDYDQPSPVAARPRHLPPPAR
jgi:3'(2'), 5'-bisphosphate nucleotidase